MASSIRTELLIFAVLTSALSPAWAAAPEAKAKAEALEGKKAFDTGRFSEAITHYEEAYRIKPAPGLLFNLAQSHRRAGHYDKALFYFRRYLETNPPETQAKAVEQLISQVEVDKRDFEASQQAAAERAARAEEEERARAQGLTQLQLEARKLEVANAEAEAARKKLELEQALKAKATPGPAPVYTRWWFWGAVGAVAAGTGVAIGIATAPRATPTTWQDINAR